MKKMLDAPLPAEAIKPHPTKSNMSTINAIFVTERLNEVFGVGLRAFCPSGTAQGRDPLQTPTLCDCVACEGLIALRASFLFEVAQG